MSTAIEGIRNFLKATDFEGIGSDRSETIAHNGLSFGLEAASAIPVASAVAGTLQIAYGAVFMLMGVFGVKPSSMSLNDAADDRKSFVLGGGKSMLLGAAAVLLPGIGNYLNGVAAAKDAVDIFNA